MQPETPKHPLLVKNVNIARLNDVTAQDIVELWRSEGKKYLLAAELNSGFSVDRLVAIGANFLRYLESQEGKSWLLNAMRTSYAQHEEAFTNRAVDTKHEISKCASSAVLMWLRTTCPMPVVSTVSEAPYNSFGGQRYQCLDRLSVPCRPSDALLNLRPTAIPEGVPNEKVIPALAIWRGASTKR